MESDKSATTKKRNRESQTVVSKPSKKQKSTYQCFDAPKLNSREWDGAGLSVDLIMGTETKRLIHLWHSAAHTIKLSPPHPHLQRILQSKRVQANTTEWLAFRHKLLTASGMSAILKQNKYATAIGVLMQKTYRCKPFLGNEATQHGTMHEAEAAAVFRFLTGLPVIDDIGLIVHPYQQDGEFRFAATPDFLILVPTETGEIKVICLEIKCPYWRKIIPGEMPGHYMAQLQMQMEVTETHELAFVQYIPGIHFANGVRFRDDASCGAFDITMVKRDPNWWTRSLPIFNRFWDMVVRYYKQNGLELGEYCEKLAWKAPPTLALPTQKLGVTQEMEYGILEAPLYLFPDGIWGGGCNDNDLTVPFVHYDSCPVIEP